MARKYKKGGESRLSIEGLKGQEIAKGKVVRSIRAHGQKRRKRTVYYVGGGKEDIGIYELVGDLIESREK